MISTTAIIIITCVAGGVGIGIAPALYKLFSRSDTMTCSSNCRKLTVNMSTTRYRNSSQVHATTTDTSTTNTTTAATTTTTTQPSQT